jgi:hypothetical protein
MQAGLVYLTYFIPYVLTVLLATAAGVTNPINTYIGILVGTSIMALQAVQMRRKLAEKYPLHWEGNTSEYLWICCWMSCVNCQVIFH